MSDLLPCPHCGGEARLITPLHSFPYVACTMGFCTGPKPTKAEAMAAWNRRAKPPANTPDAG